MRSWSQLCALSTPLDIPAASADPCPDIEVVFARGTDEPPGVGSVDSIRRLAAPESWRKIGRRVCGRLPSQLGLLQFRRRRCCRRERSCSVHAANCPSTTMMLGGFSQGAGVIDLITVGAVPVSGFTPVPMPPEVADHVAAVAVFGNPSGNVAGQSANRDQPAVRPKTIDLCAAGDPLCTPGIPWQIWYPWFPADLSAHLSYAQNGMSARPRISQRVGSSQRVFIQPWTTVAGLTADQASLGILVQPLRSARAYHPEAASVPPSTGTVCPVTNRASSDARNSTTAA